MVCIQAVTERTILGIEPGTWQWTWVYQKGWHNGTFI